MIKVEYKELVIPGDQLCVCVPLFCTFAFTSLEDVYLYARVLIFFPLKIGCL